MGGVRHARRANSHALVMQCGSYFSVCPVPHMQTSVLTALTRMDPPLTGGVDSFMNELLYLGDNDSPQNSIVCATLDHPAMMTYLKDCIDEIKCAQSAGL